MFRWWFVTTIIIRRRLLWRWLPPVLAGIRMEIDGEFSDPGFVGQDIPLNSVDQNPWWRLFP